MKQLLPLFLCLIGGIFSSGCQATGVNVSAEDAVKIVQSAAHGAAEAIASEARRAGQDALSALKEKALDIGSRSADNLIDRAEAWVKTKSTEPAPGGTVPKEAIWSLPVLYLLAEGRKLIRDRVAAAKATTPPPSPPPVS